MKTCPRCGESLTAAYKEHIDYPVDELHEDDIVDIDCESGETYDSELIHIRCNGCDTYWYSVYELVKEAKSR